MKTFYIALAAFLFVPIVVFAHPGNTDSRGCHTCRTNCPKWGLSYDEYHCHNAKPATVKTSAAKKEATVKVVAPVVSEAKEIVVKTEPEVRTVTNAVAPVKPAPQPAKKPESKPVEKVVKKTDVQKPEEVKDIAPIVIETEVEVQTGEQRKESFFLKLFKSFFGISSR